MKEVRFQFFEKAKRAEIRYTRVRGRRSLRRNVVVRRMTKVRMRCEQIASAIPNVEEA